MTSKKELTEQADRLLAAAFNAAIEVLEDAKAPPTAKSSSTASAIRIYELLRPGAGGEKEPSEMTYDEMQEQIFRLRRESSEPSAEPQENVPVSVEKKGDLW